MNNITIELCAEDRARIDNLTMELAALRHTLTETQEVAPNPLPLQVPTPQEAETPEQPLPPVEEPKTEEPKAEEPKTEAPKQAAPEPAPTPAAPEVTVADLQAKVVQLVNAGKKAETREIILKYAQNVGSIPAEKRAEVLGLLNGLEG